MPHCPPATPTHPPGHKHTNPTPDAKTLRAEIQTLRNTISAKSNENSHNPLLTNLELQLNQKRKTLKQVYRKQNSAHLLAHAHELKVTPFTTTINTAWKLLRDYKGDDSSASPQLPSRIRTNISADKRMWTEWDIQREPYIGIRSWHQPTAASICSTPSQNSLKVLWNHIFLISQNSITPLLPLSRGHESPIKPMTPSTRLLPPYNSDPNTDFPATAVSSTLLLPTHPSTENAWV